MSSGIFFPISALLYSIIIICLLFFKKHINTIETKLYKYLLFVNFFGLILELLCTYASYISTKLPFVSDFILKSYLIYNVLWTLLLMIYVYYISNENNNLKSKKNKKFIFFQKIIFAISIIAIYILPCDLIIKDNFKIRYTTGLSVYFTYTMCTIFIILMIAFILKQRKSLKIKKYIPIFTFLFVGSIGIIIQLVYPGMLIMTYIETLIISIMYHTIENPDVKMIEELKAAKEEAEKANHAKTDFLSSMSHEIRTPLNAIVGFSECIKTTDDINEAHDEAEDVVKASHTLLEIVNGILDISKIEAGRLEIVNSDYNSIELFNDVAKLVKPKMEEKALDFSISIASDIPKTLYGDHANVKKVITNILGNASKYTEQGFVKYEVRCINNKNICRLVISVEDSGRGIKPENINKLFTKFQRLDEDRNTTIEGTGLGLAITKKLVEMMGGKIVVQSVYGSGSKFTIILDQRIEQVEEKPEIREVINTDIKVDLNNKKILIVDDNLLNLKVATKLLSIYNPNIETVENGFDCIEKIKSGNKYDMILLDDMMPKMSGIETLNELKKIKGFNTITIALTANAITGMREKYLEAGFDEYLAKPINKLELKKLLIKYLINNDRRVDFGRLPEDIYEISEESINKKDDIIVVEDKKIVDTKKVVEEDTTTIEYLKKNNIDVDASLELLGDIEMYNSTIKEFLSTIDDKVSKLNNYIETNNMKDYAIEVHSLKSDSKYLGFMTLADIAYDQEVKSKENNAPYIKEHYQQLITELNKMIDIVKKYIK